MVGLTIRNGFLAVALALGLAALPAQAMTKGQAECPLKNAPADLGKRLVHALVDQEEGDPIEEGMLSDLTELTDFCAQKEKLPSAQHDAYGLYVLGIVTRTEQMVQLKAIGIKPETIDKAFDIGPGRTNRSPEVYTTEDFNRLIELLGDDGIDVLDLANRDLRLIGTYASVSAELFKTIDSLQ